MGDGYCVVVACRVVGVSVSGYYCWRRRPPSARSVRHGLLLDVIAEIHQASGRTYRARRIGAELVHGRGLQVARCTVELIMGRDALAGLAGRHRYRKVPRLPTAADLVDRRFRRDGPDQLWVSDIECHEALPNPAVVKGHRLPFVAVDGWKLRAAWAGERRGRWKRP